MLPLKSPESFILVTGASGFLGAHVVAQLLDAGYNVRCTARGLKARFLRNAYPVHESRFSVVEVEDLAHADLDDAFKDVEAVIHVAFPAPETMPAVELLLNGVNATTNLMRQAYVRGICKFVITSSYLAVVGADPESVWRDYTFTDQDWSDATYGDAFDDSRDPAWVYAAAKKLTEAAAWNFALAHPHIDLATILPTLLLGPFAPGHAVLSMADLSTNILLKALLTPEGPPPHPVWPHFVDVRDAARAHLIALEMPPSRPSLAFSSRTSSSRTSSLTTGTSSGSSTARPSPSQEFFTPEHFRPRTLLSTAPSRKRFIVSGASFTWAEALQHLCPERAIPQSVGLPTEVAELDVQWTGGKGIDMPWRDWRETLDDAARDLERVAGSLERSGWEELFEDDEEEGSD